MRPEFRIISGLLLSALICEIGCAQSKPNEIDPATLEKLADAVRKAKYIDHYFYFPARQDADAAARRLRKRGWQLQPVRKSADGKDWLVLAQQPGPVKNLGDLHDELDRLAKEFHGEYDGWEVPAAPEPKK